MNRHILYVYRTLFSTELYVLVQNRTFLHKIVYSKYKKNENPYRMPSNLYTENSHLFNFVRQRTRLYGVLLETRRLFLDNVLPFLAGQQPFGRTGRVGVCVVYRTV